MPPSGQKDDYQAKQDIGQRAGFGVWVNRIHSGFVLGCLVLAGVAMASIMALGTIDILSTAILNKPIPGATEISSLLLSVVVFGGLAYTQRNCQHVSVDLITQYLPKAMRNILEAFALIIGWMLFGLFTWSAIWMASQSWGNREMAAAAVTLPVYPFKIFVFISLLVVLMELSRQVRKTILLNKKKKSSNTDSSPLEGKN